MEDNKEKKKSNAGRPGKDSVRRSFSIERGLSERFDAFCFETARNKTRVVEQAIEEYMDNHQSD